MATPIRIKAVFASKRKGLLAVTLAFCASALAACADDGLSQRACVVANHDPCGGTVLYPASYPFQTVVKRESRGFTIDDRTTGRCGEQAYREIDALDHAIGQPGARSAHKQRRLQRHQYALRVSLQQICADGQIDVEEADFLYSRLDQQKQRLHLSGVQSASGHRHEPHAPDVYVSERYAHIYQSYLERYGDVHDTKATHRNSW